MWVFYVTLFPILLIAILGFMTKDNYGSEFTSYNYYGITLMIYSILMSGMTSANAFMEERIKKPNMRIIYSPGSISHIYLSKIIASFVFSAVFHLLDMIFLCFLFDIKINHIFELILLFGLTELFSVTLGIMLCCIFKTEAITNQLQSIIVNLMAIFGGLMFSLDGLGSTVRSISNLTPAKWLTTTTFELIYDGKQSSVLPTVALLVATIGVMIIVCKITFRKEDCIC
jgi:ABC-2 type transport system permease protein